MNHRVATVDHVATPPTGSWAQDWSYITPEVDHSSGDLPLRNVLRTGLI